MTPTLLTDDDREALIEAILVITGEAFPGNPQVHLSTQQRAQYARLRALLEREISAAQTEGSR
jgi:hypothetical protein